MALDHAALLEVLEAMKAAEVDDRVRTAAETMYQALIEAELTAVVGAGPWERSVERTAQRNGSRPRTLTTTAGDLELRIPKLRTGSFFPCLLERRRRVRSGAVRGDHGGLPARRLDAEGRRPGQGPGCRHRDLQVRGLPHLRRAGRGSGRLPGSVTGRDHLPVCFPRRHLLQGPGQPPGGLPGGGDRHRSHRRRPPRGARLRCR
jgi:Transposase, Mutator family